MHGALPVAIMLPKRGNVYSLLVGTTSARRGGDPSQIGRTESEGGTTLLKQVGFTNVQNLTGCIYSLGRADRSRNAEVLIDRFRRLRAISSLRAAIGRDVNRHGSRRA